MYRDSLSRGCPCFGEGEIEMKWLKRIDIILIIVLFLIILYQNMPKTIFYDKVSENVYVEDGVDKEGVDYIQQTIARMPDVIKEKFTDGGWNVIVKKSEIADGYEKTVIGETIKEEKTVYVLEGWEGISLIHEFGHIYLDEHPYDDKFLEIYEKEAKSLIDAYDFGESYYSSDSVEYFCEAWKLVLIHREEVKEVAPETYEYFADLFDELYGVE